MYLRGRSSEWGRGAGVFRKEGRAEELGPGGVRVAVVQHATEHLLESLPLAQQAVRARDLSRGL